MLVPTCATWLGCAEPEPTVSLGLPAENPECPASSAVLVKADTRFHSGARVTAVPQDLSGRDLELLILRGSGFERRAGVAVSGGSVCFRDVPEGADYYLRSDTTYYLGHTRRFDLSVNRNGRPDTVTSAATQTPVRLNLTGLQPWRADAPSGEGSRLQLVSGEVAWTADLAFPTAWPVAGATQTQGMEARASSLDGRLPVLEGSKGDRLYVHQLDIVEDGKLPSGAPLKYRTVVGSLQAPAGSFTPEGDPALVLSGELKAVRQASFAPEWPLSGFTRWRAEVNPNAEAHQARFDVLPVTFGLTSGRVGCQGELFTLEVPGGEDGDIARRFTYGNPYPGNWGMVGSASYTFVASTPVVVGNRTHRPSGTVLVMNRLSTLTSETLVPGITPPRLLRIDGTDAATVRTVTSTQPVVSWREPFEGVVGSYQVEFIKLEADATDSPTVSFYVTSDRLQVSPPPGVLEAGSTYYVRVTADGSPFTPWQAPGTTADVLPIYKAATFSAAFTTP
ncbi:hypothetical protein D7V93_32325 [Corallococcus llansteffanensis]|uniref:Fibronectin type-III domain-containing protein n=1 Tax=Corallococcus llansteffanensis TaxID=2316731 RepID=A0A3A8P027_9BACT|nr:hypothetical protein D7V93_32325 [Corallococcus llansteffanensis]